LDGDRLHRREIELAKARAEEVRAEEAACVLKVLMAAAQDAVEERRALLAKMRF